MKIKFQQLTQACAVFFLVITAAWALDYKVNLNVPSTAAQSGFTASWDEAPADGDYGAFSRYVYKIQGPNSFLMEGIVSDYTYTNLPIVGYPLLDTGVYTVTIQAYYIDAGDDTPGLYGDTFIESAETDTVTVLWLRHIGTGKYSRHNMHSVH